MTLSKDTIERFEKKIGEDQKTLISDLVKISQTPAPTFDEDERAELMVSLFEEYGVDVVDRDEAGNVIGRVNERDVPAICLVAHLDTVFDRSVDHTVNLDDRVIQGPGVGDDSLGLATLLSVLRLLPKSDQANLILLATTGTEGDGNLRGSRHFVENHSEDIGFTLCLEGHRLGRIDHHSLGSRRIHFKAESEGGHVWRDQTGPNPIETLGKIIHRVRNLEIPDRTESVINFGMIQGGSAYNTVPYEADLNVELRSSDTDTLRMLFERINEVVEQVGEETSVELSVERISQRPVSGIDSDHWLVETIREIHGSVGINTELGSASSDSSVFLEGGIPTVTLGLARGQNKHRENETIEIDSLAGGQMQVILSMIHGLNRCLKERGG
jgi:tripeptide aminopeptidase